MKKAKLSPLKKKLELLSVEDEKESLPEREGPMEVQPPLNLEQKITPYSKIVILGNNKCCKWKEISEILEKIGDGGVEDEIDFTNAVKKILDLLDHKLYSSRERLGAFLKYTGSLSASDKMRLFKELIPFIANLALRVELMFPDGTAPLLSASKQNLIKTSRSEVACLMANMFFCSIPPQPKDADMGDYSIIILLIEYIFYGLMCDDMTYCQFAINEKLPCILSYFSELMNEEPEGIITITRNCLSVEERGLKRWTTSQKPLKNIELKKGGKIESFHEGMQVDFANKYIGGGIDATCLQEQILFVIYPELFVTCLFCEKMEDYEAIVVTGVQQFSNYSGYSESFKFAGKCTDPLASRRDAHNRIPRQVLAIDALALLKPEERINQFLEDMILRELNKAYIGFLGDFMCNPLDRRPVITGKWGCGVFLGSTEFKLLIQWIAASEAEREVYFCSLQDDLNEIFSLLPHLRGFSTGKLTELLLDIGKEIHTYLSANPKMGMDIKVLEHLPYEILKKKLSLQFHSF